MWETTMCTNNRKALSETRPITIVEGRIKATRTGKRQQWILWGSFQRLHKTIHCMQWSTGFTGQKGGEGVWLSGTIRGQTHSTILYGTRKLHEAFKLKRKRKKKDTKKGCERVLKLEIYKYRNNVTWRRKYWAFNAILTRLLHWRVYVWYPTSRMPET